MLKNTFMFAMAALLIASILGGCSKTKTLPDPPTGQEKPSVD